MKTRTSLFILSTVLLVALACGMVSAQITPTPVPTSGVRGSGVIMTKANNYGAFDINVGVGAAGFLGGFKYQEISTTSARGAVIYSQQITGVSITGNTARITANGLLNNIPSVLTIDVVDNGTTGDTFHINAKPVVTAITIVYDEAGTLVKGDISVFGSTPTADAYTSGNGTIAVGYDTGSFNFKADTVNGIAKGVLYFMQYGQIGPPGSMTPIQAKTRIYIPVVTTLRVLGRAATFSGVGTINGKPAMVTVDVVDNTNPLALGPILTKPDTFHIVASPLATDPVAWPNYEAGGPLTHGDLVVGIKL